MGRFLRAPQQQVVSMYQPMNLDFYSGILNKAQQDLERSTAIKASAIEKLYDIPFTSKEDSDAVVGRAQELLKGATDGDFVSPSKVTNAVLAANAEVMPGVQAAKSKAKAAEMYDNMKIRYGANAWMGTDPRKQSIVDPATGKYVDAGKFKAEGLDASEVDKAFLASQLSNLTRSYEQRVASDLPGYHKLQKVTGLTDAERDKYYTPGSPTAIEEAKRQLTTMPQLKEIFGSEEEALNRIMERNYQTSGNYKQSIDNQYITDILGAEARAEARTTAKKDKEYSPTVLFKPQDSEVEQNATITDALNTLIGNPDNNLNASDISFDDSGKINQLTYVDVSSSSSPTTGQLAGFRPIVPVNRKDEILVRERNIAQNKLITNMRKDLMEQRLSTTPDSKTGKYRAMTDKEVYDFYTASVNNSANIYGKSFQINPGLDIIGSNAFFNPDGRRKDFKDVNIELNLNDGKGWKQIDETVLAKEMGYNISDAKDVKEFNANLKTLGSDSYDFMAGDTKIKSAFTNTDGAEVSMRYNAPPEIRDYKKPVAEMYNAFVKPVKDKVVYIGRDEFTGKPVAIRLNSKFASYKGKPIIYPQAEIDESTPTGQMYKKIYDEGGYEALLSEIQQSTDDMIIDSGNVYTRKAVNLKEIE